MATPVTLAAILKTIQEDGTMDPDEALVRKSTGLKLIPHKKDFFGNTIDWSVPYAGLGGRSHTATNAEANDVNGAYARFSINSIRDYDRRVMDGQLVRKALKGGPSTEFIDYVKGEMGLAVAALGQNLARGFYGSRTGRRGIVGSFTGSTITLSVVDDSVYFNIGDVIRVSATDGAAHRTGSLTITAVDTEAGALTTSVAVTTGIAAIANGDSLYVDGDLNLSWSGWDTYNPAVAPTGGDAVFSTIDRSVAPEILAGVRINTAGYNLETVLIAAMSKCRKKQGNFFDGKVRILVSEDDSANFKIAKDGNRFVDSANQYNMEIEGFKVGSAEVVPDVFCPAGTFRILGDAGYELHSIDGVQIDTIDGNTMRKTSGDTYSLAAVIDGNFVCHYPGGLGRGTWPTT